MKYFTQIDPEGRILGMTNSFEVDEDGNERPCRLKDDFEFDFPEDFDFESLMDYRIVGGELVESVSSRTLQDEILASQAELSAMDYKTIKAVGLWLAENDNEYAKTEKKKQALRDKINATRKEIQGTN